jgi:DNA-binding transcriptional regulator of glucitol operon
VRERWLSKRAVFLHLGVLVFVPGCTAAAWWQITRAQDGNGLSYLYAVEWPVFAILSVYFWWMFIHTDYSTVGLKGMQKQQESPPAALVDVARTPEPAAAIPATSVPLQIDRSDEIDPELAAYNTRLAQLAGQGPKTWRHRETHVARRPQ